jgi:hypothetical protein
MTKILSDYERLVGTVRQITVSPQNVELGPRIGGKAPQGILPPRATPLTQYFATLRLQESLAAIQEVSIFLDLDFEEMSPNSIYRNASRVHSTQEFVQVVTHPMSRRSEFPHLASALSGHALCIQAERPDIVVEPGGELLLPSKIGGRPYFYCFATEYIEAVNQLLAEGFVLVSQMTWAGQAESPLGPWPFDEYTFHLLAKETPEEIIWRYGWG